MGGFIRSNVSKVETTAINAQVDKEVFDAFKDQCKHQGYPLNVMLELFMRQYADGNFELSPEEIIKWKKEDRETEALSTTFNKDIYCNFKCRCRENGYFVKHVLTAFMHTYNTTLFHLEYVKG